MKSTFLFKKITMRLLKMFKINRIIYKFSRNDIISMDNKTVTEARTFLEKYSPNPKTSCVCKNEITHQFDIHIIIPAFNVETYIEQCMNSIVLSPSKKYTYLVTVIDDGSTDKTPDILKKYQYDPHIEIITQENKGFSGARNTGLEHIKGRYILFVDSDDLMDWHGVEKMLDIAFEKDVDMVYGAHTIITDNGKQHIFIKNFYKNNFEIYKLNGYPWAKLFRAELFHNVCFPQYYWYEDSIFSNIIFPKISHACGISENTYYYRKRFSGITNQSIGRPKAIDSYWITERLFEERQKYSLDVDNQYYEYILQMVKLTFYRIRSQPYKVKKCVFVLFCDFINNNFYNCYANDTECKKIEKIIKSRNLGKCIAYAKWM